MLVGAAKRHGVRLISAVLGDPSLTARDSDTLALLRYGLGRYRTVTAVRRGAVLARPKLKYRGGHTSLLAARDLSVVVRDGERPRVRLIGVPTEIDGPLAKGAQVGTVEVLRRGRVVERSAVVTGAAVAEASLTQRVVSFFGSGLTLFFLAVVVVSTLQLAAMRRRATRRRRERGRRRRGTEAA